MSYPIMIDLKDKPITIVGGGNIAYRKAKNFINFGYKVNVVSIDFIDKFYDIKDEVKFIKDKYKQEYIKDSFLVVAATNSRDINQSIGEYCNKYNKLVNVIDNPKLSNFIVPSCVKRGDLIIGVSTSGKSPSLASKIKKELEEKYDNSYEEYIILLGEIRNKVLEKYSNPEKKKEILNNLVNLSIEELKKFEL